MAETADVIASAVVERGQVKAGVRSEAAAAKALSDRMSAGESPRSILQHERDWANPLNPKSADILRKAVADPTELGKAEPQRVAVEHFLELKGNYDASGLTDAEKGKIRDFAEASIRALPDGSGTRLLGQYPGSTEKKALLEGLIRDKKINYADAVRTLYQERFSAPVDTKTNVSETGKVLAAKGKEIGSVGDELVATRGELTKSRDNFIKNWAEERENPADSTGPKIPGERLTELKKLQDEKMVVDAAEPDFIASREEGIRDLSERIESLAKREANLANPPKDATPNQPALDAATSAYKNALDERSDLRKQIAEYRTRETNIAKLERQRTDQQVAIDRLSQKKDELMVKLKTAGGEFALAKEKRDEVVLGKDANEKKYAESIQNIFQDAMTQRLLTIWEEGEAKQNEVDAAFLRDPNTHPMMATLVEARNKRWDGYTFDIKVKKGVRAIKMTGAPNIPKLTADRAIFIDPTQGPKVVVREMLTGATDATGNKLYNDAEIDSMLGKPEFLNGATKQLMEKFIRDGFKTGVLTSADMEYVMTKPEWGGVEVVNKIIDESKEGAKVVDDEAKKAGKSRTEWLKDKKNRWMLGLFFAFGGPLGAIGFAAYQTFMK